MRGAARQPEEEPAPERADLDAKAARVLDGQLEFLARATAKLDRCPDPQELRQLINETITWSLHTEEMRAELARYTAANAGNGHILAALLEREQKLQDAAAKATVPGPRHSRRSRLRDVPGQVALFSVKVIAIGAGLGAAALKVLGKHAGHGVTHPAALRLTAYHLKLAAVVTASTATLAIGGAVVITHYGGSPGSGQAGSGAGAASLPGWHTSASPFPSTSLIARTVTHPKPKHGKKQLLSASGLPLLCCTEDPQPSASASSSAAPSVQASVQAGPAVLSVSTTALDLTSLTSETITLSASGAAGSWVSWQIKTTGVDLDFSTPDGGDTHGVLKAGDSVVVTVSQAASLDSLTQQAFTVTSGSAPDGQQVTVSLPVPLPSVSVPAPVSSLVPSSAASLLG